MPCAAQIAVRLANAAKEMAKVDEPGFFDGVIVNAQLEAAYEELKGAPGCLCCLPHAHRVCAAREAHGAPMSPACAEFISKHVVRLPS